MQDTIVAEHNGYQKLGLTHRRHLVFDKKSGQITVTDTLTSKSAQEYTLEFPLHLHPEVQIKDNGDNQFHLQRPLARTLEVQFDAALQVQEVRGQTEPFLGWYSPSFRIKEPTSVLYGKMTFSGKLILTTQLLVKGWTK